MICIPPQNMTTGKLWWIILRHNVGCVLHGGALLAVAAVFWGAAGYFAWVIGHLLEFGPTPTLGAGLAMIVWLGFFRSELFFSVQTDPDLPCVRGIRNRMLLQPSWGTLVLIFFCFAPILTIQAGDAFRLVCFPGRRNIAAALTLYRYLDDWGDWVAYPKLESHRRTVVLLARLGLVRVSRRFGQLQIKLVGGKPKWKKGHAHL